MTARLAFFLMLVAFLALEGFVVWKGLQLVGFLGVNLHGPNLVLEDLNYWEFMAGSLAASRETPASCRRNRLVGLTIMLPVYPAKYNAFAVFPDSALARQAQPSPLIPNPITGNWYLRSGGGW
jgi:hypothetical protein